MDFQRLQAAILLRNGCRADVAAGLDVLDIGQGDGADLGVLGQVDHHVFAAVGVDFQRIGADAGDFAAYADAHAGCILSLGHACGEQADQCHNRNAVQQMTEHRIHGSAFL
ncbi:hypothetical protein D3C87_1923520 [compost metagenome]